MRFTVAAVLLVSFLLLAGEASGALVGATQGYVIYKVSLTSQGQTQSFNLNETVRPSGQNGIVQLTISIVSIVQNTTFSDTLNASALPEVFPYLVGINNQTLSYQTNGISLNVHVQYLGSAKVNFDNTTYQGGSYQLSVSASSGTMGSQFDETGHALTLPSGLIYSVQLQNVNGSSANAQLLQTSLPVTVAAGASLPVGLALISIGLLAAIAFAVPSIFIRWRRKPKSGPVPSPQPQTEEKPSYWVD